MGGTLGQLLPKVSGIGASEGARFAASFLPTETYTEKLPLTIGTQKALELGFSVLTKLGMMQSETGTNPPYPLLKAVVKSGFLNMNPAIVYLEILQGDAASCEITVTAAAKEGIDFDPANGVLWSGRGGGPGVQGGAVSRTRVVAPNRGFESLPEGEKMLSGLAS